MFLCARCAVIDKNSEDWKTLQNLGKDEKDFKDAYKRLALRYHPDKEGSKEDFQELNNEMNKIKKMRAIAGDDDDDDDFVSSKEEERDRKFKEDLEKRRMAQEKERKRKEAENSRMAAEEEKKRQEAARRDAENKPEDCDDDLLRRMIEEHKEMQKKMGRAQKPVGGIDSENEGVGQKNNSRKGMNEIDEDLDDSRQSGVGKKRKQQAPTTDSEDPLQTRQRQWQTGSPENTKEGKHRDLVVAQRVLEINLEQTFIRLQRAVSVRVLQGLQGAVPRHESSFILMYEQCKQNLNDCLDGLIRMRQELKASGLWADERQKERRIREMYQIEKQKEKYKELKYEQKNLYKEAAAIMRDVWQIGSGVDGFELGFGSEKVLVRGLVRGYLQEFVMTSFPWDSWISGSWKRYSKGFLLQIRQRLEELRAAMTLVDDYFQPSERVLQYVQQDRVSKWVRRRERLLSEVVVLE
eukprot:339387-Hanusia_phi.AAC.3